MALIFSILHVSENASCLVGWFDVILLVSIHFWWSIQNLVVKGGCEDSNGGQQTLHCTLFTNESADEFQRFTLADDA